MKTYNVTYETWSYNDIEIGETDKKGFEYKNEPIKSITDLIDDIQSNISEYAWSSYPITPNDIINGNAWMTGLYSENYQTGEKTYWSYHFKNLTENDARRLIKVLK